MEGQKRKTGSKRLGYLVGCVFLFFIFLILVGIGAALYTWGMPKLLDYLDSRFKAQNILQIKNEESLVIDIIEQSKESVVSIAVGKLEFTPGSGLVDETNKIGTGFIVDKAGLIVTNQHVVAQDNVDYKVITSDAKEYDVVEVVRDNINDIALLKIEGDNFNALDLGDSGSLEVGQMVIAIGTPLGEYTGSATTGIISGLDRTVTTMADFFGSTTKQYEGVIQTDAAINAGNSGGPLIDSGGNVVGVNFATTAGADNISFALPINRVKDRLAEYRKYGKFLTPYLGVEYQMISETEALYYEDVVAGALVIRVVPSSPASKAGIKKGDIITKIEGESVIGSLAAMIQKYEVGKEVTLDVWSEGETSQIKVTLEEVE
jgi:serine protease Do